MHTFDVPAEGLQPSSLTVLNGVLYGTTFSGGAVSSSALNGLGTVFSLTKSGDFHLLYSFKGGHGDGAAPNSLVALNGRLYGTTLGGGKTGNGTVFSLTPAGKERTLYSFMGGSDGSAPNGMVSLSGTLYGTTVYGGGTPCSYDRFGCGTVFSITPDGSYQLLYHFKGGSDGYGPRAALTILNGNLYGTTAFGGGTCESYYLPGCGTVFSVTTAGQETVLHSFQGESDGRFPESILTVHKESLFGTTSYDGAYQYYGTAFALTP